MNACVHYANTLTDLVIVTYIIYKYICTSMFTHMYTHTYTHTQTHTRFKHMYACSDDIYTN